MSVDITRDPLARALYINGPAGITTLTAEFDRRGIDTRSLRDSLASMVSQGQATVREVQIAGQVVPLWALVGGSVS